MYNYPLMSFPLIPPTTPIDQRYACTVLSSILGYISIFCLSVEPANLLKFDSELTAAMRLFSNAVKFDAGVVVDMAFSYCFK